MKPSFKSHNFDYPMHTCFFCQKKPEGFATLENGDEIRLCYACYEKVLKKYKRKIKKNSSVTQNTITFEKQTEFYQNPRSDNQKETILSGGMSHETA